MADMEILQPIGYTEGVTTHEDVRQGINANVADANTNFAALKNFDDVVEQGIAQLTEEIGSAQRVASNAARAAAAAQATADGAQATAEAAAEDAAEVAARLQYGGGLGMIGRFRGVKEEFTIPTPGSGDPTPFDILTPGSGTRIWFCAAVTYMTPDFPQRTRRRGTFVAEYQGHYYLNWTAKPLYGIMDSRGYNNGAAAASDEATMYDRISAENFAASAGPQPGGVFIDMLTGDFYLSDNTSSDGYMVIRAAGDSTLWHE